MRLRNFINEAITPQQIEDLKTKCSQIFNFYNKTNRYLYRGYWDKSSQFELKTMHDARRPKDTDIVVHNFLNYHFKKKIGWPMRDGVPVTTSYIQAEEYTDSYPYIVFPFDGFKWAYVKGVEDLFTEIDNEGIDAQSIHFDSGYKQSLNPTPDERRLWIWLNIIMRNTISGRGPSTKWQTHNGEIFLNTKMYYIISSTFLNNQNILSFGKFVE